ncbi:sacsin-like [Pelodytes ibericus]
MEDPTIFPQMKIQQYIACPVDFFQRAPPFLLQLQNILRKYPDGGQILKELLQNADDAKASEVIFIYDDRQYGTETIYSKDLQSIQGPALLAYNNEMFTDRDWEGIQKPGNSIKRKDPNTVGRFGLGFNSVYHITDYPAIFSGTNIGILDPQEIVFRRGGVLWNLENTKDLLGDLSDQFQPFQTVLEAIGRGSWNEILSSGGFKGTLFRFPFRVAPSEISDNLYSCERAQELFQSFIRDASISLLFLRHVTTVSLKTIGSNGVVKHLLTVNASTVSSDVTADLTSGTHVKITTLKSLEREEESKWLMTTCSAPGHLFPDLEELSKKLCNNIGLDLAFPLTKQDTDSFAGRLSCVLPLPDTEENRTGLPVIINGCFDLTDDRRSIKWIEVDQQHDEAAKWNHVLKEKLLPVLYTRAVINTMSLVKASHITAEVAYGIWPDPDKTVHKKKWHNLAKELSKSLMNERILQTVDKSCWVAANEAIFLFNDDVNILKCLEDLLLLLRKPLVKIPGNVYRTLMLTANNSQKLNIVNPSFIRRMLHNSDWRSFSEENKKLLLAYVLSDGQYNDLLNLDLLPLSDGTFTSFQNTDCNDIAYIDSPEFPRTLLPGLTRTFIPEDLPSDIMCHLKKIGLKRVFKNLVCLDKDVICRRLSEALPKTWHRCHDSVTWYPEDPNTPPIDWLPTFWTFLQRYDILDSFQNQPLIPLNCIQENTTEIQLACLKRDTTLVFQRKDEHVLNDCLIMMLEKVGCTVIRQDNSWLWHKSLLKYILAPSPNNILKIFSGLSVKEITQQFFHFPKEFSKMFCNFISQAFSLTDQELEVLYQLPIFCSTKNIKFSDSRMVAANGVRAVDINTIPIIPENLLFPDVYIKCRDESDRKLLKLMKITILNASDVALVLAQHIQCGSYTHYENEAQNVMLWILRNGHTLFTQNNELKNFCRNLQFIPCNGGPTQVSTLFDPKIEIFQKLFEPENFPPKIYGEDSVLMSLRNLGLKDSIQSITPHNVLQIAKKVNEIGCPVSAMKKAQALIEVCNHSKVLPQLNTNDLLKLCSISWVPVNSNNMQTVFSEPRKMRDMTYSNVVEFSMSLTNDFNANASRILGLSDLPPPNKVIENLKTLSQFNHQIDQYSFDRKLHEIYKYIQDHSKQFQDNLSNVLIWNGTGFSSPETIVLFYPEGLDLCSNVKKVPDNFLMYEGLFVKCGVRRCLSQNEVIETLHTLKQSIDIRSSASGTDKELKLAISILDWMKRNSVPGSDDLPIPVHIGACGFSLKPLSTTLFCDMDKLHLDDLSSNSMDYNIIHEEVSPATARFLNIRLLSTTILMPQYFESWGQSEAITLRIKNILREYNEHAELFKEIIQNADDADATVCEFLVDMRQNTDSRQSLIDPGMAECHGPALWCFNNAKFTDSDFINITHIGAATKETQKKKIGKFGLGFNTVYHITDVPSIMSGSQLIIFDPNVNHIKKHIPNGGNPGIKLNLQKNPEVLGIFSDQFKPYSNVFGCKITQPFNFEGTLFRLPFRTETEAQVSKMCQEVFNKEKIHLFLDSFESTADILIIFLRSVEKVTLNFIPKDFSPEKQTTLMEMQRDRVQRFEVLKGIFPQQTQMDASSMLGMNKDHLDVTESNIIKIRVQQPSTEKEQHFFVQSSLGIKSSLQMFIQTQKTKFSFPVAGVALPLKKNLDTGKWTADLLDFKGVVFCFLPLPIYSGLPFHLNGTFSVMSNRKSLWNTTERGEWNKRLFSDAVLVALITALSQLQVLSKNGNMEDYTYHTFWPDITKVTTQFTEAVNAFYQAIAFGFADHLPALFSNGHELCTIRHACFLQLENNKDESIQKLAEKVFSSRLQKPYLAVSLPDWVKRGFINSNCFSDLQHNSFSWERFYSEIVFENLDSLDTKDRNALILHAIDMQNKELDSLLLSKPCIPSSHGKLQFIVKLVHPQGKASTLYNQQDGRFPQGADFLKPERLARLEFLGMAKDKLCMKELIERAHNVNETWKHSRNAGLKQICCVLELLTDLSEQVKDNISQAEFRNITFLPAVPPQSKFHGEKKSLLMKPTEVYHYKHNDLISMIKPVLNKDDFGKSFTFSNAVLSFLGIDQTPTCEMVLLQLLEIPKMSNLMDAEELARTVRTCYSHLNKVIQKEPNQAINIRQKAHSMPFVYIDHNFVSLEFVARKMRFDASPYLQRLPMEYELYNSLWHCVDLREEFSIQHYTAVLEKIAMKYKKIPLPSTEMTVAMQIIHHCAILFNEASIHTLGFCPQQIFIPNQQMVMCHIDKIYYNDTPFLPCDKSIDFCHDSIARAVVPKLGIKTKIHHTLEKMKVSNLSQWVSQFGAKEDLTTRLKNIISEYSSKKDILKELIQNADDSEATEIHFVLDSRTHQADRTFGPNWNPLQGPALCVYNNKTFKPEDIDGIQRLGIGGKVDRLDKTGKFGLGFNAVYHITDCPSFVTEDFFMCVFDPNLMFLPNSDVSCPGGMFKMDEEFKEMFKDVYHTFLPQMFNLQEGTVFRLPLRMAETVAKSKIANQTASVENIRELCKELAEDAETMILFLNNIKKITFSEISYSGDVKEMLSIKTAIDPPDEDRRYAFQQKLSHLAENVQYVPDTLPFSVAYKMKIICDSKKPTHWLIAKQVGVEGENKLADLQRISESLHQTVIPHGAVAACLNNSIKGRSFCTLPLPTETGLPVHINGNFAVDAARRDVCKEDGRSSKTEWNTFLLSNLIAPLYVKLLKSMKTEITTGREKKLVFQSFNACKYFLDNFLKHFPSLADTTSSLWQTMASQVYVTVFEKHVKLVPVYSVQTVQEKVYKKDVVYVTWSKIGQSTITEEPYFVNKSDYTELGPVLHSINMKVAYDSSLCKEFKTAGVHVLELNHKTLCNFLRQASLHPHGKSLPLKVCETLLRENKSCKLLLKYCCLEDFSPRKTIDLQGVPLLVTVDGMIHTFDKDSPKYYSSFYDLFPSFSHQFAECPGLCLSTLTEQGFLQHLTIQEATPLIKQHLGNGYQISPRNIKAGPSLSEKNKPWFKKIWSFFESEISRNMNKEEYREQVITAFVSSFNDWAILPVCYANQSKKNTLLPLVSLKSTLPYCHDDLDKYLFKLGFPQLESLVIPLRLYSDYISSRLLNTKDASTVLEQLHGRSDLRWNEFKDYELDMLLRFFLCGLKCRAMSKTSIDQLQSLPLFETHQGVRRCLNKYEKKYIFDSNFLLESKRLYELDPQTVFIKNNGINKDLSQYIDIPVIKEVDFLVIFLLPNLALIHEKEFLQVLWLILEIQHSAEYVSKKDIVTNALKPLKLIRDKQGALQQISHFYDKEVKLFSIFELQSQFIPDELMNTFKKYGDRFQSLLLNLGMKQRLSDDDFIRFASNIEMGAKSNCPLESLMPKSKGLFNYLLSMNAQDLSKSFTTNLASIKFIFPCDVRTDLKLLLPSHTSHTSTVALNGTLMQKQMQHESLVWTSMAMLKIERDYSKNERNILARCGVVFEPPIDLVVKNIKNVCEVPCESNELQEIRSQVLQKSYNFLQNNTSFDPHVFSVMKFIVVDDRDLAEPGKVVFDLFEEDNLRPYLFKLPRFLTCHCDFFKRIGVEEEATVSHYAKVLSTIYEETVHKKVLHPNLKKTVQAATKQLFKLIEKEKPTELPHVKTLYLPASDGKLYNSSSLVLNDRCSTKIYQLNDAFKFFVFQYSNYDLYRQENLIKCLPANMRPRMLSEITEEMVDINSQVVCTYGEHCPVGTKFQQLMVSPMFHEGLVCLLRSQRKGELCEKEASKKCSIIFEKLELTCYSNLKTFLMYDSKPLKGTCSSKTIFVNKKSENQCKIYLRHPEITCHKTYVVLLSTLAKEINSVMQHAFTDKSFPILLQMLACENPDEIISVLKENGVWNKNIENPHSYTLPCPGDRVPNEWYDALDMSILNSFRSSDYVGYMNPTEDDCYRYAIIVEELDPRVFENCQIKMYRICLGEDEFADVSVLDLYKFKRNICQDSRALVLVENPTQQEKSIDEWYKASMEFTKKEIDIYLEQMWYLPKNEREKAIRRLYLKYHPDKNIGQEELSTEICKYLQQKVKELEMGTKVSNKTSSTYQPGHSGNFSNCWTRWDSEASHHRKNHENFSKSTRCDYNFWNYHTSHSHPNPKEAQRWLKQAECDLRSAEHDVGYHHTEWVFYKVHQALEKALFAAQYMKQGKTDMTKNLNIDSLAHKVSEYNDKLCSISKNVLQMQKYGVDKLKTQYPIFHKLPGIPNDCIPSDNEQEVIKLAKNVLQIIKSYVH